MSGAVLEFVSQLPGRTEARRLKLRDLYTGRKNSEEQITVYLRLYNYAKTDHPRAPS